MNYIFQFHASFLYIPNNKVKYLKKKHIYASQSLQLNFLCQNWWTGDQVCYFQNIVLKHKGKRLHTLLKKKKKVQMMCTKLLKHKYPKKINGNGLH